MLLETPDAAFAAEEITSSVSVQARAAVAESPRRVTRRQKDETRRDGATAAEIHSILCESASGTGAEVAR